MANYKTEYPVVVILENRDIVTLSVDDNRNRVLITETESSIKKLKEIFENEGFVQSSIEEKKKYQLCDGFRKKISEEWDMHVRLLGINTNKIAIDAEVETSTEYLQHATKPQYWISVIYEIHDILSRYNIRFKLWHKNAKSYVLQITSKTFLELKEVDGKIKWKPIAAWVAIIVAAAILIKLFWRK